MFSVSTGISANAAADAATLGSIPQNEMSENDVRELPNISDEQMSVEEVLSMRILQSGVGYLLSKQLPHAICRWNMLKVLQQRSL